MSPHSPYLFPEALRDAVEALRQPPFVPVADLRRRIAAHLARIRADARNRPEVDLERAEHVGRTCTALLDGWDGAPEEHRGWIQAACLYFTRTEDDEDDLDSVVGFDDDAEVLDYVLDRVGRRDLRAGGSGA